MHPGGHRTEASVYPPFLTGQDLVAVHQAEVRSEAMRYQLAARVRRTRTERSRSGAAVALLPAMAIARVAHTLQAALAQLKCRLGYC